MSQTVIPVGDPKAIQKYSVALAVDVARESFWTKKTMGVGAKAKTPVKMLPQLESDAGDKISYDLSMQMTMEPIPGDNVLEKKEDKLEWATDSVWIDQLRGGINTGGRMTRKRTIHDLREVARARQSEWWSRLFDELFFMYGSGARGSNNDYIFGTNYAGHAGNPFGAPDDEHIMYAGDATSKADLDVSDIIDLNLIDRLKAHAEMMGGGTQRTPQIQPIRIEGADHYALLMSPWSAYNLRTNGATGQWLDIQRAAATAEGSKKNAIFNGALGMYNDVILQSHKAVVRFGDYGVGSDVKAERTLFMGREAMVCAFGMGGTGLRFNWHEEKDDRDNQCVITTSSIFGLKKCTYNIDGTDRDFGMVVADVAADKPAG